MLLNTPNHAKCTAPQEEGPRQECVVSVECSLVLDETCAETTSSTKCTAAVLVDCRNPARLLLLRTS